MEEGDCTCQPSGVKVSGDTVIGETVIRGNTVSGTVAGLIKYTASTQ